MEPFVVCFIGISPGRLKVLSSPPHSLTTSRSTHHYFSSFPGNRSRFTASLQKVTQQTKNIPFLTEKNFLNFVFFCKHIFFAAYGLRFTFFYNLKSPVCRILGMGRTYSIPSEINRIYSSKSIVSLFRRAALKTCLRSTFPASASISCLMSLDNFLKPLIK